MQDFFNELNGMNNKCFLLALILISSCVFAQEETLENAKSKLDSIYLDEVENIPSEKPKVLHAEPLYIDLIRDLGARKGEREWNVGFGIHDNTNFDRYEALVEYEWAIIDRLGLEIEFPFSFYVDQDEADVEPIPESRLEGLQLAAQYSFYVDPKSNVSLAFGYLHEFSVNSFRNIGLQRLFTGNVYSPFFVAAKRWTDNLHTLVYTGPIWEVGARGFDNEFIYQWHSNFHYMLTGTRNFIGLEINKIYQHNELEIVLRPQMRLEITEQFMIGIVPGIPINRGNQRFSTFFRLIYEPAFKKH